MANRKEVRLIVPVACEKALSSSLHFLRRGGAELLGKWPAAPVNAGQCIPVVVHATLQCHMSEVRLSRSLKGQLSALEFFLQYAEP